MGEWTSGNMGEWRNENMGEWTSGNMEMEECKSGRTDILWKYGRTDMRKVDDIINIQEFQENMRN